MPSVSVDEGVNSTKSEDDDCIVSERSREFKQFMGISIEQYLHKAISFNATNF